MKNIDVEFLLSMLAFDKDNRYFHSNDYEDPDKSYDAYLMGIEEGKFQVARALIAYEQSEITREDLRRVFDAQEH